MEKISAHRWAEALLFTVADPEGGAAGARPPVKG